MENPTEQTMEGSKGRARRAPSRPQKHMEEPVVPDTRDEADIPLQDTQEPLDAENTLDVPLDPKPTLPSEGSFTETSPYFPESTPQTSTRRLRPRTFRSPIKVPPLLLSRRVTRSASTTTPRAQKQDQMADTNEKTPEKSKGGKSSKTPKEPSSKKPSKEKSDKPSKDVSKTPSKRTAPEKPPKSSARKSKDSTTTASTESELALKYGDNFDWEEYASFCMRRTRLPTDPSVNTAIENIRLYGNWRGENRPLSANKTSSASKKKQTTAETSAIVAAESSEEKRRTKEERKIEKELKKQRKEERRRKKEEKKLKKEREGESKKKHKHKKKHQEGDEKEEEGGEEGTDTTTEDVTPIPRESTSSPGIASNTATETTKPAKSKKRKSDDSEAPKPKRAKKSAGEAVDVENASSAEESKSTTKQRKSPAKVDLPSTALETVSESVLNLGSNSPSKRIPAGTSIIVPPPVDADRFGLIQEEVCHNPYYLLIATVFLQKTKASSAIPVFREFLRRWPTPGDLLANGTMGDVKDMFDPLGLHTTRAKTVWMMAHHFHLLDPYKKPLGPQSWKVRRDYRPEDPTGLNRKWGCIIGDVYGCGTYAIDSWRIFCMKPGEGGFLDGTTLGKPQKRKTDDEDTPTLPVAVYQSDFVPGDEEWRRISPDREVLDKELQAYIRWMHAKDAARFGTTIARA